MDIYPSLPWSAWHLLPEHLTRLSISGYGYEWSAPSTIVDGDSSKAERKDDAEGNDNDGNADDYDEDDGNEDGAEGNDNDGNDDDGNQDDYDQDDYGEDDYDEDDYGEDEDEFYDNSGVGFFPFDALPRSISELFLTIQFDSIFFCGPPPTFRPSFFPPNLTYLSIHDIQLHPETAKYLPPFLTRLDIANMCEEVCQHLPAGLKSLNCFGAVVTPNLIEFLPRSLTNLDLRSTENQWYNYVSKCYSYEPRSFEGEGCTLDGFDWKDAPRLPPSLTRFSLSAAYASDSFMQYHQLPNLLELDLCSTPHVSDIMIPLLSRNLTSLTMWATGNITGKSFEFLPRGLTLLNIEKAETIFDSDIKHLPRTLTSLNLGRSKHLTDLCMADLPRHLEVLLMRRCNITLASFPDWPYPLKSPQISAQILVGPYEISRGVVFLRSG